MAADCPAGLDWCAGGHRCANALGEHRSDPVAVRTRYGTLVATRVRQRGRGRLEVRLVVELPPDELGARRLSSWVLLGVHRIVQRIVRA